MRIRLALWIVVSATNGNQTSTSTSVEEYVITRVADQLRSDITQLSGLNSESQSVTQNAYNRTCFKILVPSSPSHIFLCFYLSVRSIVGIKKLFKMFMCICLAAYSCFK